MTSELESCALGQALFSGPQIPHMQSEASFCRRIEQGKGLVSTSFMFAPILCPDFLFLFFYLYFCFSIRISEGRFRV